MMNVKLVRAECVRCHWLLAQTKVATILGIGLSMLRAPAEQLRWPLFLVINLLVRAECVRAGTNEGGPYFHYIFAGI